jgi:hypothetical protein
MTVFHIIKDIILKGHSITPALRDKLNRRWLISIGVGLVILFLLYACGDTGVPYNKGPSAWEQYDFIWV